MAADSAEFAEADSVYGALQGCAHPTVARTAAKLLTTVSNCNLIGICEVRSLEVRGAKNAATTEMRAQQTNLLAKEAKS
jgi:hypothetical protein